MNKIDCLFFKQGVYPRFHRELCCEPWGAPLQHQNFISTYQYLGYCYAKATKCASLKSVFPLDPLRKRACVHAHRLRIFNMS